MRTRNYQNLYRRTFATLGTKLTARDSTPPEKIAATEKKLGLRLPRALRDFYLVAGRERFLNQAHNHLCTPSDWETHAGKVIFLAENQCAVVWAVTASSKPADDPAVYQGPMSDGEPSGWFLEQRRCSAFMVFMVHLQASFGGGMACTASAPASKTLMRTLDTDWHFAGEVNGMRAYSRDRQAVCFAKWQDFLGEGKETWRVFAGACAKDGLEAIATELELEWD